MANPSTQGAGLAGVGGIINGQDPNYIYSIMQAQRQQQMAQMLTQEGASPIQYDTKGAISPYQGLAKMLQSYLGATTAQSANRNMAGLQAQGNQNTMQALQTMFGGGSGANGADPAGIAPSAAMAQGAMQQPSAPGADGQMINQGGVGPTNANAARMAAMLQPQGGQTTGAPAVAGGGLSIPGMDPSVSAMVYMLDPEAYLKAALAAKTPTDAQKNSRDPLIGPATISNLQTQNMPDVARLITMAQSLPPGDPRLPAIQDAIAKSNFIAPNKAGQGETLLNPITGKPIISVPKTSDGIGVAYGENPNGGLVPTSASPIPGYSSAASSIARANSAATTGESIATRVNPDGTTSQGRVADLWPQAVPFGNGMLNVGTSQPTPAQLQIIQRDAARNGIQNPVLNFNRQPQMNGSQSPTQQPGNVSTGPAPGTVERAVQGQTAAADYMKSTYSDLASARQAAPAMQQELARMQQIGQNPTIATGPYGTAVAKLFSSDAAEYEKGRDFVVAQLASQGGMSTDAARSMVYGAIPGYDAPQAAKLAGLQNLSNQIGIKALKANILTPHVASGDVAGFTNASNQFDQNVTPAMYPALTAQPGPQRAAMLSNMAKDQQMRTRLEWAAQNGLLK